MKRAFQWYIHLQQTCHFSCSFAQICEVGDDTNVMSRFQTKAKQTRKIIWIIRLQLSNHLKTAEGKKGFNKRQSCILLDQFHHSEVYTGITQIIWVNCNQTHSRVNDFNWTLFWVMMLIFIKYTRVYTVKCLIKCACIWVLDHSG